MDTIVLCRHWGTHLDHHPFLHHSELRGCCGILTSHQGWIKIWLFTPITSLLTMMSSSFSDRRHRIHPCGVVFFLVCSYLFNLIISNDDAFFRSDDDGFICWGTVFQNQAH